MKKQYVVIGLGRFGTSVAKTLAEQGADVLVIDANEEKVDQAISYATHAVQADATDEQALRSLGIRNFDVACVCLGEIQSSIMAALICKEQGIDLVLVKAQSEVHAKVLYKMGVDKVVFPERDMGQRVARSLVAPNILALMALSDDDQIAELTLPTDWADKTIVELNIRRNFGVSVLGIHRGGKFLTSPGAETMLMAGDVLLVMGKKEAISAVQ